MRLPGRARKNVRPKQRGQITHKPSMPNKETLGTALSCFASNTATVLLQARYSAPGKTKTKQDPIAQLIPHYADKKISTKTPKTVTKTAKRNSRRHARQRVGASVARLELASPPNLATSCVNVRTKTFDALAPVPSLPRRSPRHLAALPVDTIGPATFPRDLGGAHARLS